MKNLSLLLWLIIVLACQEKQPMQDFSNSEKSLHFNQLAKSWDEAIPLGNGMLGALIWEKDGKLRFSLDRVDLWDLRPMENLDTPKWKFGWVYDQWKKNNYKAVQEQFDVPYDRSPAPSKIPGAALEFDISSLGEVQSVDLFLENALCEIKWKNGVKLTTFVHATKPFGWYRFEGIEKPLNYTVIPPAYNTQGKSDAENPVEGQDLRRLGYPKGEIVKTESAIMYNQEGWGGFKYQVSVDSKHNTDVTEGYWSISSEFPGWKKTLLAKNVVNDNLKEGIENLRPETKETVENFMSWH